MKIARLMRVIKHKTPALWCHISPTSFWRFSAKHKNATCRCQTSRSWGDRFRGWTVSCCCLSMLFSVLAPWSFLFHPDLQTENRVKVLEWLDAPAVTSRAATNTLHFPPKREQRWDTFLIYLDRKKTCLQKPLYSKVVIAGNHWAFKNLFSQHIQ